MQGWTVVNLKVIAVQERPIKAEHLLGSGDTYRCMNLAAIADSMDHLADIIQVSLATLHTKSRLNARLSMDRI